MTFEEFKRQSCRAFLEELMAKHGGCARLAAEEADMNRTHFYAALRTYGVPFTPPPRGHLGNAEWHSLGQ